VVRQQCQYQGGKGRAPGNKGFCRRQPNAAPA
jgi:hypothetical protein